MRAQECSGPWPSWPCGSSSTRPTGWPHFVSEPARNWSMITCAPFTKSPNCASHITRAAVLGHRVAELEAHDRRPRRAGSRRPRRGAGGGDGVERHVLLAACARRRGRRGAGRRCRARSPGRRGARGRPRGGACRRRATRRWPSRPRRGPRRSSARFFRKGSSFGVDVEALGQRRRGAFRAARRRARMARTRRPRARTSRRAARDHVERRGGRRRPPAASSRLLLRPESRRGPRAR